MNSSNNETERFIKRSELCKAVCLMNKDIDLVTIINKNGRIIESEFNKSTSLSHISKNELEMISMQRSLQTLMAKEFDQSLSTFNHTITIRESYTEFIYPFDDGVLLVISNVDADVRHLSSSLSSLISRFQYSSPNVMVSYHA